MPTPFCFFPSFLQSPDDVAFSVQSGRNVEIVLHWASQGHRRGQRVMKHIRPFVGRKIERSVRVRLVHVVYGWCPQSSYSNFATRGCPHKLRQIIPRAGTKSKEARERARLSLPSVVIADRHL